MVGFRRSLQAGSHSSAQLWGFWGFNLAYKAWFRRWGERFELREVQWSAAPAERHSFPWVGGRMPWSYGVADLWGRVLTAGHKAWDRPAAGVGKGSTWILLLLALLVSRLLLSGCAAVEASSWPLPFPSVPLALAIFGAATLASGALVDRLWRCDLSAPLARAGLIFAGAPVLAGVAVLPDHARGWRLLCAISLLTFLLKGWDLLARPRDREHSSLRVASFLWWWPGLDFSRAFRVDHTRELVFRHVPLMAFGTARLWVAALLFPALFLLALHGEHGAWGLLGLVGRLALVYLLLRGVLEYWTAWWRMVGCELPEPFGGRPFGPSPRALWRSWNVPLQDWLKRHVYLPLGGRDRPVVAVLGSFLLSGSLGALSLAPVVGRLPWELPAFFLAQAGLVLLEQRLAARGAPRVARRLVPALLVALFLLLAPWLFAVTDRVFV